MKKISLFVIPLLLFIGGAVFLLQGLFSDPRERDSMVVGKPIPQFSLPDLYETDLIYTPAIFDGKVTLLNVWGVWCVTCAVELPYLTELVNSKDLRIVGLYYDQDLDPDFGTKTVEGVQSEVTEMLARFGNPYQFNIFDVYRDLALDLGVTGAPEHFLIDKSGVVRLHHVGDVNERVWQSKLQPAINALRAESIGN
jgi:cytochrome c biogenesis protein CcmG/thiol:disulfide interchange protein DsbE